MGKLKMILLDAGHGGMIDGVYQTKGKRSPVWEDGTQCFEGVTNRLIRSELVKLLKRDGIRYKIINPGQRDMGLSERVNIANAHARKYGAKNCLFISIHSDGWGTEAANGWSCYTSIGQTLSDEYATALYEEAVKQWATVKLREKRTDGDPDKEANFYVLRKTICPAILSENFFMTNRKDCKFILSRRGQKEIAQVHYNMIKRFIKKQKL